jgi:hypothetical protein
MHVKIHQPATHRKNEPQVGIFWVVGGKLVIDSTVLGDGERYGDHLSVLATIMGAVAIER